MFFVKDMASKNHFEIKIEYPEETNGFQVDQDTDYSFSLHEFQSESLSEVGRKLNIDWGGWWPEVEIVIIQK